MATVRLRQPLTAIDLTTVGDTYAKNQELENHCQPLRCCPQAVCYKVSVEHTHGRLFTQSLLQDNGTVSSLQQGLGTLQSLNKLLAIWPLAEDIAGPSCRTLSGHPLWHSALLLALLCQREANGSDKHWPLAAFCSQA